MRVVFTIVASILLNLALSFSAIAEKPTFPVRAAWMDASEMASQEKIDNALDKCKRAKINVILPDVMSHSVLRHKSSHYLYHSVQEGDFDPLAYLLEKAHKMGMKVHPWYCVYYDSKVEMDGTRKSARPEWVCTTINGEPMSDTIFLSPQVPGVNDYILSVMKDGLAYDIDGIHLDYIRYYGTQYDYSWKGREPFINKFSFDPINFLDHAERIVPIEKDPFPIRVLRTNSQVKNAWESTWIESLMDRAQIGFGMISEKPELVDALPVPGALVVSCYYEVTQEMADAIERYVARGGNLLWIDAQGRIPLKDFPILQTVLGIKPATKDPSGSWKQLKRTEQYPLSSLIIEERNQFSVSTPIQANDGAAVIATFATGEPAVIYNRYGYSGRTLFVSPNLCKSYTAECAQMVHDFLWWFRSESGVKSKKDPMEVKRAQWIKWRSECITELVRNVKKAVKTKDKKLAVSMAASYNDGEYTIIFRDTEKWLNENLLDFGCPMDYQDDVESLRIRLESHSEVANEKQMKTVYPGLSIYTRKTLDGNTTIVSRDANMVKDQLQLVYDMGFLGYTVFATSYLSEEQIAVLAEAAE